jgi:mono/diheme cytochrome c family protein
MIFAPMSRRAKIAAAACSAALAALALAACGTQSIKLAQTSAYYPGAKLFLDHCSGCHTLSVVGARGSAPKIRDRERINGPNFDFRQEQMASVLYAIRNGGFSGAIMPQDIVVGADAQAVAQFLSKYSGLSAPKTVSAHP